MLLDNTELSVIMVMPVDEAVNLVPGSQIVPCAGCSVEVLLAPTSQARMKTEEMLVLCYRCCARKIAEGDFQEVTFVVTEEAIRQAQFAMEKRGMA